MDTYIMWGQENFSKQDDKVEVTKGKSQLSSDG